MGTDGVGEDLDDIVLWPAINNQLELFQVVYQSSQVLFFSNPLVSLFSKHC